MRVERLGIVLAAGACLCSAVAVVPPRGGAARGLRVELAGSGEPGHALLLRLAVQDAEMTQWWSPASATASLRNGAGAVQRTRAQGSREAPWMHLALAATGPGPYRVHLEAEGLSADFTAPVRPAPGLVVPPPGEGGFDVLVEGRVLVPEVQGAVLVRHVGAAEGEVLAVRSDDASVAVSPESVVLDRCGVGEVSVTVHGMGALLGVSAPGSAVTRRRLPVLGTVGLRHQGQDAVAEAVLGGNWLYWAAGDGAFASAWGAMRMEDAAERNALVTLARPPGAYWLTASNDHRMQGAALVAWPHLEAAGGCRATPLGARFEAVTQPAPLELETQRVFEGVRGAVALRGAWQRRLQRVAVALGGLFLLAMMAVIVAGALRKNEPGLGALGASTWQRTSRALAVVAVLGVLAWVLVTAMMLRS